MNKLKGILEQSGLSSKLVMLFAVLCFFVLILTPISSLISVSSLSAVEQMKLSQLFLSIGTFILPPFVLAYLCSKKPSAYLYLNDKMKWSDAGTIILFMLLIIPVVNLLGDLNQQLVLPKSFSGLENWMKLTEDKATRLEEKMLQVHSWYALFFNIVLIAVLPAIGEELFFRGALIRIFREWRGFQPAIWIVAFIFSAIHLQFYGFVPRLLLGAFFGYLLLWSGNLWLPILAHFINNVVAVIFYYLRFNGYKLPDIDSIGFGNTLWIGLLSGALGIFGILWLRSRFNRQLNNPGNL
ncbi:MAG: CPBP family intramembrane metalloprotease [Bacteroidota bacterium]|nr:CPBP family intramembrane metalloprotease [Bacteroidota bacterium]